MPSPTSTVPGSAADWSLAARLTASPVAPYSMREPAPIAPTTTGPDSTPTRTPNPSIPQLPRTSSANSPISSTIRNPARRARSGSSSWATGAPKSASTPSPARSLTVPPNASTAPTIRPTASPTTSFSSSGSRRSPSAVDPTRSAKRAVTNRRSSRIAAPGSLTRCIVPRPDRGNLAYACSVTAEPLATKTEVGRLSVAGLAFAPFAILFSFWIPTLALLFAAVTLVSGALDLRGSTGLRRRAALFSVGLGLAAIALTVIVVVVTSGPSSGNAVTSVPPPG